MEQTVSLASLVETRSLLPVRPGVTSFDSKIKSLLRMATRQIEIACKRTFAQKDYVEIIDSQPTHTAGVDLYGTSESGLLSRVSTQKVILRGAPVDPETLDVRYDYLNSFGETTRVPSGDLSLDDDQCTLFIRHPMIRAPRALKISYKAGYAAATEETVDDETWKTMSESAPFELQQACILQAVNLWNKTDFNNVGLTSDGSADGAKFSVKGGLLPDVISLVYPYRKILSGRN